MNIDSADFTNDERLEACEWVEAAGYDHRKVRYRFTVEPALPGSVKLTFEHYRYNERGQMQIVDDHAPTDEFTIYASERLGWLQRYLMRTGATLT